MKEKGDEKEGVKKVMGSSSTLYVQVSQQSPLFIYH